MECITLYKAVLENDAFEKDVAIIAKSSQMELSFIMTQNNGFCFYLDPYNLFFKINIIETITLSYAVRI